MQRNLLQMLVPEVIDPTDYDESDFGPGYTPFGEEKKPAPAASSKPAKPAPPPPAPEPTPEPVADDMSWLDSLAGETGAAGSDLPDLSDLDSLTAELGGVIGTGSE